MSKGEDDSMEAVNLISGKDAIDAYGLRPSLNYDIEGLLVEKDGKKVKIEKSVENEKVYFSIRLREEIKEEVGQRVKIDGANILSYEINKPREEDNVKIDNAIEELGLESSDEIKEAISYLIENGIEITEENISSFLASKDCLKELTDSLDFDTITKLLDMGIDIMEEPIHKVFQALSHIKENNSPSIKNILKSAGKLSYREAEKIARNIYGRKMGKDVYDAIIALKKVNMPVNKENIERILELVNKLYDLKDSNNQVFIEAFKENMVISIENLYRIKHSYKSDGLDKNMISPIYEEYTVAGELDYQGIVELLKDINIEVSSENIDLARNFLLNEVPLTEANFQKLIDMKNTLKELMELLDEENIASFIREDIDPLKEDITKLVEYIKSFREASKDLSSYDAATVLEKLNTIKEITDKELVYLIRTGQDFSLENLKNIIDTKINLPAGLTKYTLQKTISLLNIFNTLGELDSNTIYLAANRYKYITLNNLYESSLELAAKGTIEVKPVDEAREGLIRQEYLNIRKNTSLNLIKESIKDGLSIEDMPLDKLHSYVNMKKSSHEEIEDILKNIRAIKGREELSVLTVLKKDLNMSLREISSINISLSFDTSSNQEGQKGKHKHKLIKNISQDDLVLEIPISLGDELSNLSLIVPNMKNGINKEDMTFYISLATNKLGPMEFSLNVKESKIYLEFETMDNKRIMDNISYLEEIFNDIGYELKVIE
ncbi:MAG: hypothetical protein GX069_06530 [Tissierellia bacterium]|nr:hypothetical protein [Tissierellia bacterium]